MKLIARKQLGRNRKGDAVVVPRYIGRALIAIGLAEVPPAPVAAQKLAEMPRAKREYKRRDMVAETASTPVVDGYFVGGPLSVSTKEDA